MFWWVAMNVQVHGTSYKERACLFWDSVGHLLVWRVLDSGVSPSFSSFCCGIQSSLPLTFPGFLKLLLK